MRVETWTDGFPLLHDSMCDPTVQKSRVQYRRTQLAYITCGYVVGVRCSSFLEATNNKLRKQLRAALKP